MIVMMNDASPMIPLLVKWLAPAGENWHRLCEG
jgi:hypothetical protein